MIVSLDDIRESKSLSYSSLLTYSKSPYLYRDKELKQTTYFSFGSLVDHLLTSKEPIFSKFYVSEERGGSTLMDQFLNKVEQLIRNYVFPEDMEDPSTLTTIIDTICKYAYDEVGFKRQSFESVQTETYDTVTTFYNNRLKLPITEKDLVLANRMCSLLKENPFTSKYFLDDSALPEHITRFFQLPVAVNVPLDDEEIPLKGVIDLLYIDHSTRTIEVIDIKTTGKGTVYDFSNSFFDYRYDLQSLIYYALIEGLYNTAPESIGIEKDMPAYTINFYFIVIDKTGQNWPIKYSISDDVMNAALLGTNQYKGFLDLYKDFYTSQKEAMYSTYPSIYDTNGVVEITLPSNIAISSKE